MFVVPIIDAINVRTVASICVIDMRRALAVEQALCVRGYMRAHMVGYAQHVSCPLHGLQIHRFAGKGHLPYVTLQRWCSYALNEIIRTIVKCVAAFFVRYL